MESFDYVIVGAGSAGSVLASRLSEDPNVTVCVLEAGPRDWHPFIHIPAGFMYTLVDPKVNWLYKSEPSEWTGGRAIAAPRGKTLGGSSSINGHIYNRGQRLDFDGWAQRGNRGWGYSDVLPYFRRSEHRMASDADATFRGSEGSLPITDLEWRDPLCEAFIEGAVEQGIPRNPDYNGTKQAGVSYVQRIIQNGRRVSAARGYLHPAMSRPNLTVRTHAQATSIVLEGKRAVGVRYRKGGRNGTAMEIRATREVILSGGTVNSPQLLQLSGIGPGPLLNSLGIEVKHALAGVGRIVSRRQVGYGLEPSLGCLQAGPVVVPGCGPLPGLGPVQHQIRSHTVKECDGMADIGEGRVRQSHDPGGNILGNILGQIQGPGFAREISHQSRAAIRVDRQDFWPTM